MLLFSFVSQIATAARGTYWDTLPVGIHGGIKHRPSSDIVSLVKFSVVVVDPVEGPACTSPLHAACNVSASVCAVENNFVNTLKSVKALDKTVITMAYINSILMMPYFRLSKKFYANNSALSLRDSALKLMNFAGDGGKGFWCANFPTYDYTQPDAVAAILADFAEMQASGAVDGVYLDKSGTWPGYVAVTSLAFALSLSVCSLSFYASVCLSLFLSLSLFSLSLFLSLSPLSLSLTHTHSLHPPSLSLPLSLSLSLLHTCCPSLSLSLSPSNSHTLSRSLTHSLSLSLPHMQQRRRARGHARKEHAVPARVLHDDSTADNCVHRRETGALQRIRQGVRHDGHMLHRRTDQPATRVIDAAPLSTEVHSYLSSDGKEELYERHD